MSKVRLLSGELLGENGGVLEQVVQLSRLQKLLVCALFLIIFYIIKSALSLHTSWPIHPKGVS